MAWFYNKAPKASSGSVDFPYKSKQTAQAKNNVSSGEQLCAPLKMLHKITAEDCVSDCINSK